jgi:hypothetical protein
MPPRSGRENAQLLIEANSIGPYFRVVNPGETRAPQNGQKYNIYCSCFGHELRYFPKPVIKIIVISWSSGAISPNSQYDTDGLLKIRR